MSNILHNIKIKFKAFHPNALDKTVVSIAQMVTESGGVICGPIPMPRRIERFSVTRSPHVDKKSMEQFMKTKHTRVLQIIGATQGIIEELSKMEVPSGIGVEISITKA
jgi:small subunit ribosomal protein S10